MEKQNWVPDVLANKDDPHQNARDAYGKQTDSRFTQKASPYNWNYTKNSNKKRSLNHFIFLY
jgi:hypothetical protein